MAQAYAPLFTIAKYAGAIYLIYIAIGIWQMPARPVDETRPTETDGASRGFRAFLGAYLLTLGNPKTMVFFLSIMPLVVDPAQINLVTALEIAAIIMVVLTAIFMGYVMLADRAAGFCAQQARSGGSIAPLPGSWREQPWWLRRGDFQLCTSFRPQLQARDRLPRVRARGARYIFPLIR